MGLGPALHNDELTNSQLEAVARGFSATPRADLVEPFAAKYFETVDWVWANKTYHMAEALLNGLYPGYADPATLTKLGDAWLRNTLPPTTPEASDRRKRGILPPHPQGPRIQRGPLISGSPL